MSPISNSMAADNTTVQDNDGSKVEKGSIALSLGNEALKAGDIDGAKKHWELSAKDGNFFANWQLARYYLGMFNKKYNIQEASNYLHMIVKEKQLFGDNGIKRVISANAMVELGVLNINGFGDAEKRNVPRALKYLKLAASAVGHPRANFLLGELHFDDKYIPKERRRALTFYTLAARKGYFLAQIKLGLVYFLNGKDDAAKVSGLAWLILAKENKPKLVKQNINQILSKKGKSKFELKQLEIAKKLSLALKAQWEL